MTDENTGEWIECVVDSDYEIFNEYPYPIRRKDSDKVIKEHIGTGGYLCCHLNLKKYKKHRIIAEQFVPNPDNLPMIDHINRIKTDNRIENLRWVSGSDNQRNKSINKGHQYVFYDELPETAEPLDAYNGHEFDGLFIDYENEKLYLFNGINYRELVPLRNKGNIYYIAYDIEGHKRTLAHKVLFG